MEKAIKKAIEGGYKFPENSEEPCLACGGIILLDPLFWQALKRVKDSEKRLKSRKDSWLIWWHSLIDHLADGKDIDSFFNNLLTTPSEQEEK